jgi:hypothetical protein
MVEGPPRDHAGTGVAKVWHEAQDLPGAFDMQRVAKLFTSLRWWTLKPADDVLARQSGRDDPARFVAAARSDAGDLVVLYLPVGGTVELSQPVVGLKPEGARWFDPRSGRFQPAKAENGRRFTAPDAHDWVLVLQPAITTSVGGNGCGLQDEVGDFAFRFCRIKEKQVHPAR